MLEGGDEGGGNVQGLAVLVQHVKIIKNNTWGYPEIIADVHK